MAALHVLGANDRALRLEQRLADDCASTRSSHVLPLVPSTTALNVVIRCTGVPGQIDAKVGHVGGAFHLDALERAAVPPLDVNVPPMPLIVLRSAFLNVY